MKHKRLYKILTLFILLFILARLINIKEIIYYLKQSNIKIFLTSIILLFPLYLFKSIRLYTLLRAQGIKYELNNILQIYFSSNFLGFITPGRVGEFAKAVYIKQDMNISLAKSLPSIILDRFFDLFFLAIVSVIGLLYFNIAKKFSYVIYFSFILIIFVFYVVFNFRILKKINNIKLIKRLSKVNEFIDVYIEQIKDINILKQIIVGSLLTYIAYIFLFIQCKVILLSIGINISYNDIMFIMAITNMITFLPISISGIGTRELILIFLFSLIGIEKEIAVTFSVLVFIAFNLIGGLIGLVFWTIKPIEVKSLKVNLKK